MKIRRNHKISHLINGAAYFQKINLPIEKRILQLGKPWRKLSKDQYPKSRLKNPQNFL